MLNTPYFNKSKFSFRVAAYFFVIIMFFAISPVCFAQNMVKENLVESDHPKKNKTSESVSENKVASPSLAFVQYAHSAGVRKCLERIEQVTKFLTGTIDNVGGHYFISPSHPDNMMISLSMEIPQPGSNPAYASASFAPNQANGSGGMYETVVYWPQDCESVAQQRYPGLQKVGKLSNQIIVLDGGPTLRVFLMPAGTGCIAIKKELIQ